MEFAQLTGGGSVGDGVLQVKVGDGLIQTGCGAAGPVAADGSFDMPLNCFPGGAFHLNGQISPETLDLTLTVKDTQGGLGEDTLHIKPNAS